MAQWPFDHRRAQELTKARQKVLGDFIEDLGSVQRLSSVLDVGCGLGDFTRFLHDRGFEVIGIDGREENVKEAKRRNPDITFFVKNIEDPGIVELGSFDLVVCPGLLYHLENPFRAIRNLAALTKYCLWVETMIIPDRRTVTLLVEEGKAEDQGLNHMGLIPSLACLVKMLYAAGFAQVYRETRLPDHPDFRSSIWQHSRRTLLVASPFELQIKTLSRQAEPRFGKQDLTWARWPHLSR